MPSPPTLMSIPTELREAICTFLSQQGLLSLILCNSILSEIAIKHLYMAPEFASTYRFAQFTFIVVNNQHYAQMVRSLDMSKFNSSRDKEGELTELAGWREFKYRNQKVFSASFQSSSFPCSTATSADLPKQPRALPESTHPPPSPLLSSFHRVRDVPIGGVHHVLGACTRIKHLNMSWLHLASDFMVKNPTNPRLTQTYSRFSKPSRCKPKRNKNISTSGSDVPNSWTWKQSELIPVYADALLNLICQLGELETFTARNTIWLSTTRVKRLMKEAQRAGTGVKGLGQVDFTNSGMESGLLWAIEGSREKVESIVGEVGDVLEERASS